MAVSDDPDREPRLQIVLPKASQRRFRLLKRESQQRLDKTELRHGEFLELLMDVWELHSGEYSRADLPQDATAPEWIRCYCTECEKRRKHAKTGGDRSLGIAWYACAECGSGVRLDLAPVGGEPDG